VTADVRTSLRYSTEADQNRGDLGLDRLFAAYDLRNRSLCRRRSSIVKIVNASADS
jgi:hypothetical protein